MSYKVVQTVAPLTGVSSASPSTSSAISLKSGSLRISTSSANAHVAIGTTATTSDFHVTTTFPVVLKERIARQQIAGITTGTSTIVIFGENAGNPFSVGDYVSVEGVTTAGINTTYVAVTAIAENSITINSNTSSVVGIITVTNSTVARSVKVSALGEGGTAKVCITEVQISSQS